MTNVLQQHSVFSDSSQHDTASGLSDLLDTPISGTDHPTDSRSKAACQCPQTIVAILEESESKVYEVEIRNIDKILAHQKKTLKRCKNALNCTQCNSLSDHMMLLAVVCRKLVSLMEEVVSIFLKRKTFQLRSDSEDKRHRNYWNLLLGDYTIDSEAEWAPIIKVIIVVHLRETLAMLDRLKRIARTSLRDTQLAMLQAIDHRVAKMAAKIRSSDPEARRTNST